MQGELSGMGEQDGQFAGVRVVRILVRAQLAAIMNGVDQHIKGVPPFTTTPRTIRNGLWGVPMARRSSPERRS